MAKFDPSAYKPKSGGMFLETAGTYLLGFTGYKGRKENARGTSWLEMKTVVICGPQEGKIFTAKLFITAAALERLAQLCHAMGWKDPWDPESDKDVKRVLLLRPFKAKIAIENEKYAKIAYAELNSTDEEQSIMDDWVTKTTEALSGDNFDNEESSDSDDDGDPGFAGSRGRSSGSKRDDDDIPF